jgi:hypothetical protein
LAQTFTPSVANTIQDFKIHAWRTGSPGSVTGAIYAVDGANKPTGSALCTSSSVNANNFPTSDAGCCFQTFTFASGANLLAGVQYAFVLSVPSGSSGQEVDVMADTATHSYAGGAAVYNSSGNSGDANWAIQTADAQFEEFGALYITTATLTLSAPTNITATSATLNGNITVAGGNNPTVTIYWQANSDGGNIAGNWANTSAPTSPLQPQGVSAFYLTLTGLTAGTTYYFNAYAVNAAGGVWAGTSQSFTTSSASTASVSISAATAILSTSAILNGNVTAVGGANPTVTIYYGTADGGNVAGNWQKRSVPTSPTQPQGVAAFYLNISGLSSSTKYYFNASVTNSGGTVWAGASLNFTTSSLFADTYKNYFPIIITDTSGVARTNVPILTGLSGQGLINSNYVNSGATDTAMKLYNTGTVSDTDEPYNIDTAEIPIVIPSLPANGSVEFDLYTGYSPVKTSFPIIVGNGGKLTTSYNVALELGSAWEIDVNNGTPSYINTSTSEIGAYILNKAGEATIKVTALNQLTATVYDGSGAETIVLSISSGVYSISLALASGTLTFTVGSSSNTTSVGTVVNNTNNWIWDSDGVVMPYISNIELKVPSGSYPTLRTYVNPASSPTMIYNQTELQNINNNLAGNYELANDITCSGEFVPIGAYPVSPFTGILDGNGYKIKNLSQTAGYGGGGLFGYIGASGIVQNIQMTNCTIGANLFWDNQGAICGDNAGTIQNCYSTGAVEGETFIGGLVGTNEGTIQNCYSWCSVTASQSGTNGICGGLCGQNSGTITGCYETGTLSGKYQDGFCKVNSGTISSSYCDWTESGTSACSGVANTTDANMKIQSTYSGWNFTVVWFPLVIIELQYQPNTIISGTTLPDLSGNSYNGTITWGANSNITISNGSPNSSQSVVYNPSNGASGAQSGSQLPSGGQGYQLPQVTMPANWYGTTNTNLPLYGVFTAASQSSGIPVNTLYFIIMVLVAFGAFFFSVVNTHSIMLSGAVFVGLLAMESGTGVVPGWIPYVMGIGVIGILFLARQIG